MAIFYCTQDSTITIADDRMATLPPANQVPIVASHAAYIVPGQPEHVYAQAQATQPVVVQAMSPTVVSPFMAQNRTAQVCSISDRNILLLNNCIIYMEQQFLFSRLSSMQRCNLALQYLLYLQPILRLHFAFQRMLLWAPSLLIPIKSRIPYGLF